MNNIIITEFATLTTNIFFKVNKSKSIKNKPKDLHINLLLYMGIPTLFKICVYIKNESNQKMLK